MKYHYIIQPIGMRQSYHVVYVTDVEKMCNRLAFEDFEGPIRIWKVPVEVCTVIKYDESKDFEPMVEGKIEVDRYGKPIE